MTANHRKSYLPYLNKLVDEYNNTYHHSISNKLINADYSALTGNIQNTESNAKARTFKVNDRVRITKYKNVLVKATLETGQEKYLLLILFYFSKNHWTYKIKDLNGEKIIGSFYEKKLLRSIL